MIGIIDGAAMASRAYGAIFRHITTFIARENVGIFTPQPRMGPTVAPWRARDIRGGNVAGSFAPLSRDAPAYASSSSSTNTTPQHPTATCGGSRFKPRGRDAHKERHRARDGRVSCREDGREGHHRERRASRDAHSRNDLKNRLVMGLRMSVSGKMRVPSVTADITTR